MRIIKNLTLVLFSVFFSQTSIAQDKKNILTVDVLSQLNQIQTMVVSPDGANLVYGLKKGIESSDNHLYILDVATGKQRQLTTHKEPESNLQYSADGKSLYFLSNRSGRSQVWQLPLSGGEAQQVTNLPLDVNAFIVARDETTFALEINVKPGCSDFACTLVAQKQDKEQKHKVRVYEQLMVRHWDRWNTAYKNHLFVAKKIAGRQIEKATDLMPNWFADIAGIDQVSFSPDAKNLVFSAKAPSKEQAWTTNFDLFEVNLATNEITNITEDNKAWDAKPVYSNNGRYLAYLAMTTPGYESDKFGIKVRDNTTGTTRTIANQWDRSVSELVFADDNRTLYVTAQDIGQRSIFEINPEFGDVRSVYNIGTSGNIAVVDDKIYFTRHSLNTPEDIFVINRDSYGVKQLSHVNKNKLGDIHMAEYKQFSFKGWQEEEVFGYWLKPANYQQGQTYPIAFLVHGGPQGSFGNMFHYRWNAQLWAAQGYGVVMVDFHGSTGYGQKFTDSITGDWGGKPLEDLQKGLAYITKAEPWLDVENACALGASYGGYMMNWIAGHWSDGFKCLVNHAGLYDMPSFYTSTEELWFPEHDMGGPVWQGSDDYSKFNPAAFVNNWKTPMLVTQGELDYRVPYTQSLSAFTTLQRKGIDSRLVMFPNEDHHIRNSDNLKFWYKEIFNWLDKYTKPILMSDKVDASNTGN
jgi:dipeptidyl aminopeptidase/acylaminoacyl peptidase